MEKYLQLQSSSNDKNYLANQRMSQGNSHSSYSSCLNNIVRYNSYNGKYYIRVVEKQDYINTQSYSFFLLQNYHHQVYFRIKIFFRFISSSRNIQTISLRFQTMFFLSPYYKISFTWSELISWPLLKKGKFTINNIYFIYLFHQDMARTKQTARKTCASKVPRRAPNNTSLQLPEEPANVNTDQFSLKFDDQEKCEKEAVSQEMRSCSNCEAFLTTQSRLISSEEYEGMKSQESLSREEKKKFLRKHQKVWICEFCMTHNDIPEDYEPPAQENPCLLLKKGKESKEMEEEVAEEDKMLIFCIDISGSMDCVFGGKSRLNSVKEAIGDEIKRLKFEKSKIKVGLITFGSEVHLIGDAKNFKQKILPTNLYTDFNKMVKESAKVKNFCEPLSKSFTSLKKIVGELKTSGLTALGPGLIAAVQLASQGAVGSKVILCTDGQANVGIGGHGDANFYNKMATEAKKKKVMMNILSLKGDNCNLKHLSKLSLATGGSLLKIDPNALGTEFSKIMEEEMLGTQSLLTVKLNKIFKICNPSLEAKVSKDGSTMHQDYGNFSAQTQLIFQFQTIHKEEAEKIASIDKNLYKQKRVPMQIQLQYTGRKGEKYLQIITDWRELVEDEKDVYDGANFGLFAASVLQRASKNIRDMNFAGAQAIIKSYWKLVKDKFQQSQDSQELEKFNQKIKKLEKVLNSKKAKKDGRSRNDSRGRGGGRKKMRRRSQSRSRSRSRSMMDSDSEEQVLMKGIRARSRSRSREKNRKKK